MSMRVLCVTDQSRGSEHPSVEEVFGGYLAAACDVHLVYFQRGARETVAEGNRLFVPYGFKRGALCGEIGRYWDPHQFDVVIVRNYFPVLREVLRHRRRYGYRVGFWNSFPHTYRRLFEAQREGRNLLRKGVEYHVRTFFEQRVVSRCDFLLVMSREFKELFYREQVIPWFALPMGVTFDAALPRRAPDDSPGRRFIYTGTVDHLRDTALIVSTLSSLPGRFSLDIYTRSDNGTTARIKALGDPRVRVLPGLPRRELLSRMVTYDIGIGLVPDCRLYRVSSPTKTVEYYGVGIPALVNHLPEYDELFDETCAFFSDFTREGIGSAVQMILSAPRARLVDMGRRGHEIIRTRRNFKLLSEQLFTFLQRVIA